MKAIALAFFLAGSPVFAQDVSVVLPDQLCKIDLFNNTKEKLNFKPCDGLKDAAEVNVKSMEACKQRALQKAGECLKKIGAAQVQVRGKFTEKFKISSKSTTFTCEMDKNGDSACP